MLPKTNTFLIFAAFVLFNTKPEPDNAACASVGSHGMRGEVWTNESWVFRGRRRVILLSWRWSSFHHWGAKTEKSRDFAELVLLLSAMVEPVGQLMFDQCLEVDRSSSVDGLEGQHHRTDVHRNLFDTRNWDRTRRLNTNRATGKYFKRSFPVSLLCLGHSINQSINQSAS